jgi:two-component system sensor histidine kinase RegB
MVSAAMTESLNAPTPADAALQGDGLAAAAIAARGLHVDTVTALRWIAVAGEAVALCVAVLVFGARPAFLLGAVVVALTAALNLAVSAVGLRGRLASSPEATGQLALDVLLLSALLYFTGGVANPFSLLLIAPVVLAASSLSWRSAAVVGGLAVACGFALALWAWPLPLPAPGQAFAAPQAYRLASAVAIAVGIGATSGFAWLSARQAAQVELALHVTQAVLAREQRLSALGGLAAAAAHELGTPLATISVVAKELSREGPEAVREDARLLLTQTDRCREILRRLTREPEAEDEMHARMTLVQLLNEVLEPHANAPVRVEAVVVGAPGADAPDLRRMPEVLRAMTSLVDNAVDFAASEVLITARFDGETISVEVRDDGPGFAPDILGKLGQPYVTSRPSGENSRSHHSGMGLGFFIAKTLLERTGARMEFRNARPGGAVIVVRWPRDKVEAPPIL